MRRQIEWQISNINIPLLIDPNKKQYVENSQARETKND